MTNKGRARACVAILAGILLLAAPGKLLAGAEKQQAPGLELARLAEEGESIFKEKCSPCHTLGGGDRPTGPDLEGVIERRDRQWLMRIIREPDELIAEKDPQIAALLEKYQLAMPDLGVSQSEAEALLAYLEYGADEQALAGGATVPREGKKGSGDRMRGRRLYVGEVSFENGGAPCVACHGFDKIGPVGAASYGGDLTGLWESYGEEGVRSILADLPFPSMTPIYGQRPLTEAERADLAAFFEASAGTSAPGTIAGFTLRAIGWAAFLFLVAMAAGWRRISSVRRSLLDKTLHSKS